MEWYKIKTYARHCGAGSSGTQVIYMWAKDICEVLGRYKRLPAVPRSRIPDIISLNSNEVSLLERAIIEDRNWSVKKAKKSLVRYSHLGCKLPPV